MGGTFENLLSILPSGVVSKKDIGERRMLANMLSWSVRDAAITADISKNMAISTKTTCDTPRTAYTPRSTALHKEREREREREREEEEFKF